MSAPTITPVYPTNGMLGVPVRTNIVQNITDVDGISVSSVKITVNGEVAWENDAAGPSYTGSKTVISGGYQYTVSRTNIFAGGVTIPVSTVAKDLLNNQATLNWSFKTIARSFVYAKFVFPIDTDVIRIVMSSFLSANSDYYNVGNYTIAPIDDGEEISILEVMPAQGESSDYIDLRIVTPGSVLGKTYSITIAENTIRDAEGKLLFEASVAWFCKRTKVDSSITHVSRLYDTTLRSSLRSVMQAIMISDEMIGSTGEIPISRSPLEFLRPRNWGTGYWGGHSWGG